MRILVKIKLWDKNPWLGEEKAPQSLAVLGLRVIDEEYQTNGLVKISRFHKWMCIMKWY